MNFTPLSLINQYPNLASGSSEKSRRADDLTSSLERNILSTRCAPAGIDSEIMAVLKNHRLTPLVLQYLAISTTKTPPPPQYHIIPSREISLAKDVPSVLLLELAQFLHDGKSLCRFLINLPSEKVRLSIFRSHLGQTFINSILRAARGNFKRLPRFITSILTDGQVKNQVSALDFTNCPLESPSYTLRTLFQVFPSLKLLELENCHLTDNNLFNGDPSVIQTALESLSLVANPVITTISSLAVRCSHVTNLNLGGCLSISARAIEDIITCMPKLNSLSLAGCAQLSDASINLLTEKCPNLTQLDLYGCFRITDLAVRSIASNLRSLTHLNLGNCIALRDLPGLSTLPCLSSLSLFNCLHVSRSTIENITSNCGLRFRPSLDLTDLGHEALLYPSALVSEGSRLRESGRLEEARFKYERALAVDPKNVWALTDLSVILTDLGHLEDSRACLEQVLLLKPEDAPTLAYLGMVLHFQGDLALARTRLEEALEIDKNDAFTLANLGTVLGDQGDLALARICLQQALKIESDYSFALANLGAVLCKQGDLVNARVRLEQALKIDPNYSFALRHLAVILRRQGDHISARNYLEKALEIEPKNASMLTNLVIVLRKQGNLTTARAMLEKALIDDPSSVFVLADLGVVLYEQGDLVNARACLEQAFAIDPNNAFVLTNLGAVLCKQGELVKSLSYNLHALLIQPMHFSAHANMGIVLQQLGNLEEARESLELALKDDLTELDQALVTEPNIPSILSKEERDIALSVLNQIDAVPSKSAHRAVSCIVA